MAAIDRRLRPLNFLPDAMREALRRTTARDCRHRLLAAAVLLALALATWSVQDPSFSHATNAPVRNVLGRGGAIVADLLMQLFGLAAIAPGSARRDLGLAAGQPPAARAASACAWLFGRRGAALGGMRRHIAAQSQAGRCRAGWAALSAIGCCACPLVAGGTLTRLPERARDGRLQARRWRRFALVAGFGLHSAEA